METNGTDDNTVISQEDTLFQEDTILCLERCSPFYEHYCFGEKVKFKHIVFLSCFMYCWFKKKQKIPQITYKIIFTLSPRKLAVSILQNLLWLFRWLYRVSQKKIALKFPDFGPFLIFWTFGTLLDNFGFWITQILTLLDLF